jgi:L-fuculose-phosphate aldolase
MQSDEQSFRREIVTLGQRLYLKGFIAGPDGNISVRLDENRILCTPSGVSKGFMSPEDLVIVDLEGRLVSGNKKPSSEIQMHTLIYRNRKCVNAVVHAHPPTATGFASSGIELNKPIIAEAILTLGSVPLAEYGTPGTDEVVNSLANYVKDHDAILMANHGVVTYGENLEKALFKMETVEHYAVISLVSEMLGKQNALSPKNVEKLIEIRNKALSQTPSCEYDDRNDLKKIVTDTVMEVLSEMKKENY